MLKCDQLLHRAYRGRLGQEAEVYILFWATPASTAHMHHPDVCMACRGWKTAGSHLRPVPFAAGRPPLPVSARTYELGGRRQLVFYWTQQGDRLLPDGPEDTTGLSEYAWVKLMLSGQHSLARTSRLAVRVDTELQGPPGQQEALLET